MANIAPVQNNNGTSVTGTITIPLTTSTTAGNFLLAGIGLPPDQSVASIVDTIGGRWIQCSYAESNGGDVELWYSRGIQGGSASVTITTAAASVGVSDFYDSTDTYDSMDSYDGGYGGSVSANVSEWSGIWYLDPLSIWSQNLGSSASIAPQTITPKTAGDLVITIGASSASVGAPSTGTALTLGGDYAMAYDVLSGSVAAGMYWPTSASATWAAAEAAFMSGVAAVEFFGFGEPTGTNPLLQFPEMLVEMCPDGFLSPYAGTATWQNVSCLFRNGTLGPLGRQHELDRVQAASGQMTFNNRGGWLSPWNSSSFLYPGCLDPMTPVKTTAAWNGITYPVGFQFIQSITPAIADVLNVDATVATYDLLQNLSLKYLASNNFAQLVLADGGPNLAAFYRLGDQPGAYGVKDSSGQGATGSLIAGAPGTPAYGYAAPFLYDPSTSLDLTNASNVLGGGFNTTDNSTQPPTQHQPLSGASAWTYECWLKWLSSANTTAGQVVSITGFIFGTALNVIQGVSSLAGLAVGDAIVGTNLPDNTTILGVDRQFGILLSQDASGVTANGLWTVTGGATGATIFSAASVAGVGSSAVDIRVGAATSASITSFNRVTLGTYTNGLYTINGFSTGATNVMDGAWHHIAVPYAASVATIYVDGVNSGAVATTGSWSYPADITIGCDAGPANGWPGAIANVALYTTALTAEQIANHYETGMWFQLEEYGAGQGNTTAGRFNKVMAVAGLDPETMLYVPYPFKTLLYAETNPVTTTSALNYMQTESESEPGLIFQQPNGVLAAYSRQYQYLSTQSTEVQAVFADHTGASVTGHYDGPSLQIVQDDLDSWNDIQVQSGIPATSTTSQTEVGVLQEWGPSQSTLAAQSASVYGGRTLQGLTSLQMANNSDALAIAQNYFAWYGFPHNRVVTLMTNNYGNQGRNIPQQLERGLYDRMTIQYQGQTPGPQFSQDSLIESVAHSINIDAGPTWTTVWQTSPYEILMTPFIFGNTAQSQLAGAASVSGSGTSWILHPAATNYASGTVTMTVAAGTATVPYDATAAEVQTALAALVTGTTCSGGPLNSTNVSVTFGGSQGSFTAYFTPSQVLTL